MREIFIFFIGALLGIIIASFFMRKKDIGGIVAYTQKQQNKKESLKEKILEMIKEKGTVANDDVEKTLGVSDASATNYLSELEREGKIEQIGERGRFVSYRIKS